MKRIVSAMKVSRGGRIDKNNWFRLLASGLLIITFLSGCAVLGSLRLPALGKAGKYRQGKSFLTKPRGAGVNEAVPYFEEIAKKAPTYRNTLALLGRAYYHQRRYQDSLQILQRALAVNKEDEIAWLVSGLARLRLGDEQKGLENFKGGLALLVKVSKSGYMGYDNWDLNGLVRTAIRRAILQAVKNGLGAKERLIRLGDIVLYRIDDEEAYQAGDRGVHRTFERDE